MGEAGSTPNSEGSGSTRAGHGNIKDESFGGIEMPGFPTSRRLSDPEELVIRIPADESPTTVSNKSLEELDLKWINDEIIKKKNLPALIEKGGVPGIAKALKTDLDNGISGHRLHAGRLRIPHPHGRRTIIFKSLREAINNFTVLNLFLAALLSLGFSLMEDGLHHLRWQSGVILFLTATKVVLYKAIRDYREIRSNEKLQNSRRFRGTNMRVKVVREGEIHVVSEQDLVVGDIAVLEGGDYVPGDGLFISGKAPVIDGGSYESFDPFLQYGSRVLSGSEVRMLVTAVRMETGWGEMMSRATLESPDNECRITAEIHAWNDWVEAAMLLLSILINGGQCLHIFRIGMLDDDLPDSEGAPSRSQMPIFMHSTIETLIGSLCVSLLGITTITKWVITKAINIWNHNVLIKDKASRRDRLGFLKMVLVTAVFIDGGLMEDDSSADLSSLKEAISTLMEWGIRIILVSRNNTQESKTNGEKYGILTSSPADVEITVDNSVLTAKEFEDLTEAEKKKKAGTIQIMANCDTCDKIDLIKRLQKEGHVVAFLGQRMMDAPALKQADVGISIGKKSCEVANESSDIVILVSNWSGFLVDIVAKARSLEVNIGKVIQMQLICTGSSSFINFLATVFGGKSAITTFQMLCLNVAIPCCGGLMLLTEPLNSPSASVYNVRTKTTWRNIGIQVFYLTLVFLILVEKERANAVHAGFFLCQIFNTIIAREPEKKNVWSGLFNIHKNKWGFVGLILLVICLGVSVEVEAALWSSGWPSLKEWGVCLVIGAGSWLLDSIGKILYHLVAGHVMIT